MNCGEATVEFDEFDECWLDLDQQKWKFDDGVAQDMLNEQDSPVFSEYVVDQPPTIEYTPRVDLHFWSGKTKIRDWQIDFGPVHGEAGTTTNISIQPNCWFRGDKVFMSDSAGGSGARLDGIIVGNRVQSAVPRGGIYPSAVDRGEAGAPLLLEVCGPALTITASVTFVQSCTFNMCIFGKCKIYIPDH